MSTVLSLPTHSVPECPEYPTTCCADLSRSPSYSRESLSSDDFVSSECTSEQEDNLVAEALLPFSPMEAYHTDEEAPQRCEIEDAETVERFALIERFEVLERVEVARQERTTRDEIKKARALYMRSVLATAPHRGFGPSVWPRHMCLPQPTFYETAPYTGAAPSRSCLRRHQDGQICHKTRKHRIVLTDSVAVQAGIELPETDGELASAQWRSISMYAPVRHMVMTSLKTRFGADASDPHAWMSLVEDFAWLDEIFCSVKDTYQLLHNEEAAEWNAIIDQERAVRKRDWWSKIFLWPQ